MYGSSDSCCYYYKSWGIYGICVCVWVSNRCMSAWFFMSTRERKSILHRNTECFFFHFEFSKKLFISEENDHFYSHSLSLSLSPPDSFCLYLNHSLKSFRFSRSYQFPWISVENLVKMHLILIVLFSHRSANDVKNCILYHFDRTDSMRNI